MSVTTLVWFRHDLRLIDNPALTAAAAQGPVVPVFIQAPAEEGDWPPGAASRWWLHRSLESLAAELERRGSRLILGQGESLAELRRLAALTGAQRVVWNRRYEPAAMARDARVTESLREDGIEVESFNGALLAEPFTVANQSGKPFQVFTPFWKHVTARGDPPVPVPAPERLAAPAQWPESLPLGALGLLPAIHWYESIAAAWQPGERGAHLQLARFLDTALPGYADGRNRPDLAGTSRLSPHLHFGELSPRQVWAGVMSAAARAGLAPAEAARSQFLAEIGWREFGHHLLYHFPQTPLEPLRAGFSRFAWRDDAVALSAWQRGRTGIPLVDAGMRELWQTGWMHNRVRMVVASFLVKNLRLPWQAGARWFWDTLVDADLASNTLGWQWSAGCGADAAPYFRIFNPVSQGEKFDPAGDYVRRYVPELAKLPADAIHAPWQAPAATLKKAGVELGRTYPPPIVDLKVSREQALAAFKALRG